MSDSNTIPAPENLTKAQKAVYRLVVQGLTSQDIALELNRTLKTVENHRYAINRLLKVNNPAALVARHYETLVLPGLNARVKALEAAMHKIAYEPIGAATASDREMLDEIVVIARRETNAASKGAA